MGDVHQSGSKAAVDFQEDSRAPLIELNNSDSTELWLIQWPKDQIPDFNGQEILLNIHHDGGLLGTFESSYGKSYDVFSLAAQEPATVFLSSATDSNMVGKITRRVSFVNYLDSSEVPKGDANKLKQFYERSSATSLTNSAYNFATPTKSTKSGHPSGRASTHSSGRKNSLSEEKGRTKDSKASKSTRDSAHTITKRRQRRERNMQLEILFNYST